MSYLQLFEREKNNLNQNDSTSKELNIDEINLSRQNISDKNLVEIIESLNSVKAANFSHNRIKSIPTFFPKSVNAINLSFNIISSLPGSFQLDHIIELNLSHNKLESMENIESLSSLEYLDISFNNLSSVEGVHGLTSLKIFRVNNNHLYNIEEFRILSFFRHLIEIDVKNNPFVKNPRILLGNNSKLLSERSLDSDKFKNTRLLTYQEIKIVISNFIPTIRKIDGSFIRKRISLQSLYINDGWKYSELHKLHKPASSTLEEAKIVDKKDSSNDSLALKSLTGDSNPDSMSPCGKGMKSSSDFDTKEGLSQNHIPNEEKDDHMTKPRSKLPWKNPPNPIPRPFTPKYKLKQLEKDINIVEDLVGQIEGKSLPQTNKRIINRASFKKDEQNTHSQMPASESKNISERILGILSNSSPKKMLSEYFTKKSDDWMSPSLSASKRANSSSENLFHKQMLLQAENQFGPLPIDLNSSFESNRPPSNVASSEIETPIRSHAGVTFSQTKSSLGRSHYIRNKIQNINDLEAQSEYMVQNRTFLNPNSFKNNLYLFSEREDIGDISISEAGSEVESLQNSYLNRYFHNFKSAVNEDSIREELKATGALSDHSNPEELGSNEIEQQDYVIGPSKNISPYKRFMELKHRLSEKLQNEARTRASKIPQSGQVYGFLDEYDHEVKSLLNKLGSSSNSQLEEQLGSTDTKSIDFRSIGKSSNIEISSSTHKLFFHPSSSTSNTIEVLNELSMRRKATLGLINQEIERLKVQPQLEKSSHSVFGNFSNHRKNFDNLNDINEMLHESSYSAPNVVFDTSITADKSEYATHQKIFQNKIYNESPISDRIPISQTSLPYQYTSSNPTNPESYQFIRKLGPESFVARTNLENNEIHQKRALLSQGLEFPNHLNGFTDSAGHHSLLGYNQASLSGNMKEEILSKTVSGSSNDYNNRLLHNYSKIIHSVQDLENYRQQRQNILETSLSGNKLAYNP